MIKTNIFKFTPKVILFALMIYISLNISYIYGAEDNTQIYSNNVIAIDAISGNILFEKDAFDKVYPASTTKILTAILAIENLNLDDTVVCSKNAVYSTPIGSSSMYLRVGETLSVKDLLYGLMLQSGNDAANVLAEQVSGNIPEFVKLMNKKLREIGCNSTNFTNAHGFHDDDHYTTPYDMAKLMQYAMKNDTFREIVETKYYEIAPTDKTSETRYYNNTDLLLNSKSKDMYYEYCLGGKTGYTEEARGTFVGYGEKDGKLVIVATFDGSQNISGKQARFLDSITLFDYSFLNYTQNNLLEKSKFSFELKDEKNSKIYKIGLDKDLSALTKSGDKINVNYNVDINNVNLENIKDNDIVGKISINAKGDNNSDINLNGNLVCIGISNYTDYSVLLNKTIKIILIILLVIILFLILSKIIKNRPRKANKSYNKIYGNSNRRYPSRLKYYK